MKQLLSTVLLVSLATSALAVDKSDLDFKIRKLTLKFEEMQAKPDKRIPAEALRRAKGIILLDRVKAGFGFAYQGGGGIIVMKDPSSGQWGAPAFISAREGSFGFQVGGQESFTVVLLMNTNTVNMVTAGNFDFGSEASGTAGNNSSGVSGTISGTEPLIQVYTDASGLYGGVSFKGGSLSPDTDANVAYYNQYLTTSEILFGHKVKISEATSQLNQKLTQSSS